MLKWLGQISIGARLTIIYSLVVCLTLVLFMLFVYSSIVHNLENEVDKDLAERASQTQLAFKNSGSSAEAFARLYNGDGKYTGGSLINNLLGEPNDLASALTYLQIIDPKGEVIRRVPEVKVMAKPSTQESMRDQLGVTRGTFGYIRLAQGERARVYTLPLLNRMENQGYVQAVRSLQEVDAITAGLVGPFVVASTVAVFLLGVFGWWFTRRTFQPIQGITEAAYRIGVNNDLAERIITDPTSNDEVSRLGRAFNAMLERLEKNFKAQKQFIADSSHELRTPLTVIRGNVDLLKRNPDPQNQAESLQAIERESARMQRLVQDLLLLAQADARQSIELVPLQLDDLVLEVFKETRVLADQRRQRLKLGHFGPVLVEGDRDRLKRAILNLVDNAIKYTPEEGEITVSLRRGKQWARVVVADNGPGIAAKDQPLIFDRFFRVDKARSRATGPSSSGSGGGSGLGLSIVKYIIEAHGGRITVESEAGLGSTFTIWLKTVGDDPTLDEGEEDEGTVEIERSERPVEAESPVQ